MSASILTLNEAQEKVAAQAKYPRVTKESIEAKIMSKTFHMDDLLTICVITMQNGFKVIGVSAPADERNYMKDVGEAYAYENAFKQLWQLEGYLLRDMIYVDRMRGDGTYAA